MSKIGDNTGIKVTDLKTFLDRIERLEDERATIAADIKDVKNEAKAAGFDKSALNFALSMRKKSEEQRAQFGIYANALSLFD